MKILALNAGKNIIRIFNRHLSVNKMANSRYEYVKSYEIEDKILQNVWIIVRVDGKGFHKFSKIHDFDKPNDLNALNLMNHAAIQVMEEFRDIVISYGQSDEYSFVFRKDTDIFNRRSAKLLSYVTSIFTSSYVFNWKNWFPNKTLKYPPCFDGRIVLYPSDQNLKDYLSWRQADVHINNLYNTAFWNLIIKGGLTNQEAEAELRGTFSSNKNELLFTKFGVNYNNELPIYRKGTILLRKRIQIDNMECGVNKRQLIIPFYEDLIREKFWKDHSELLGKYIPSEYSFNERTNNSDNNDDLPLIVKRQLDNISIS